VVWKSSLGGRNGHENASEFSRPRRTAKKSPAQAELERGTLKSRGIVRAGHPPLQEVGPGLKGAAVVAFDRVGSCRAPLA